MSRSDLDPMAMAQIEEQGQRIVGELNQQVRDLADTSRAAAAAEHLYKMNRAKLLYRAEGRSADQREAWAMEQPTGGPDGETLADLDYAYRITAAERDAVVERGRSLRAQLDWTRTLAANARPATANSSGMGG